MPHRGIWLVLVLAVLVATIGGYVGYHNRHAAPGIVPADLAGRLPPAIELPDLDGRLHRLSDYRGRRILLNFWATWCVPCLKEMPALSQAQEKFGEHDAIVIGIAMDEPDRVRAFLAAHPVNYPILMGRIEEPNTSVQFGDANQILPYSVLIGEDGRMITAHAGILSPPQLEQWLAGQPSTALTDH